LVMIRTTMAYVLGKLCLAHIFFINKTFWFVKID
jgi:hypothetical protein